VFVLFSIRSLNIKFFLITFYDLIVQVILHYSFYKTNHNYHFSYTFKNNFDGINTNGVILIDLRIKTRSNAYGLVQTIVP